MSRRAREGELAIVLHPLMPTSSACGTWPVGARWPIATSYAALVEP